MTTRSALERSPHALLVEDIAEVRRGLARALQEAFEGIVVHEASTVAEAERSLRAGTTFRLALVDLGLPDGSGIDLIRTMRESHPELLIIVVTIYDDDDRIFSAIAAGAGGYLLKEHRSETLVQHLRAIEGGVPALSPAVARKMLAYFQRPSGNGVPVDVPRRSVAHGDANGGLQPALTQRETEVLSYIARGLQRGEVAGLLQLSENTVAKYLKDIYRKLNISSRAEAALEAARRGLL